jgi:four helix bundle protein
VRSEGAIEKFEDLLVWQKSHILVLKIYKLTKNFPVEEKFGLVSQMRRAAVSIAANIVEGFRKRSRRDKINFYNIAQSSADELRYYVILAKDLGYLNNVDKIYPQIDEVGKMLNGLIGSINLRC